MLPEDTKWVFNTNYKLWIPEHKKRTGFGDKTSWDWIQLIIQVIGSIAIPASIIIGLWQFSQQQRDENQRILKQQAYDQQKITEEQRQTTLQSYLDHMSDLLLKNNLRDSKVNDDVRHVARAQTLTAIQGLDNKRKALLLQFLHEARLIGKENTVISLQYARLDGADLSYTDSDLSDDNLSVLALNGANLSLVALDNTDLHNTGLTGADLRGANLRGANLNDAFLEGAKLGCIIDPYFGKMCTDLSSADLSGADLSGADLSGAMVFKKQLDKAGSLQGAIMPDGSKHT